MKTVVDEENLKYENDTFEAVLSNLSLHWINDLPGIYFDVVNAHF